MLLCLIVEIDPMCLSMTSLLLDDPRIYHTKSVVSEDDLSSRKLIDSGEIHINSRSAGLYSNWLKSPEQLHILHIIHFGLK